MATSVDDLQVVLYHRRRLVLVMSLDPRWMYGQSGVGKGLVIVPEEV